MSSLVMSVRPSTVKITLKRGSDRSAEPIDLKIGLNMGNSVIHIDDHESKPAISILAIVEKS